ncbi:prenylcysteine oxidase [Toxoplasma gondii p89]|uniref:Prenylcysteine oxidase n=1 Tax=Toxoplasma gondii p89 TaxID=943119 RepID=A0A086JXY2_TOXGO|nr:prenylcysteine oxidase [Toxoplasma gondii p89]
MLWFRLTTLLSFMYVSPYPSFANLAQGTPLQAFNSASFPRCLFELNDCGASPAPAKVAIIGGGISGAATAAFLRMLESDLENLDHLRDAENRFGGSDEKTAGRRLVIDLFEAKDRLGGRLDYAELEGAFVELGGADIHETNAWMVQFHELVNAHLFAKGTRDEVEQPASSNQGPQFLKHINPPDAPIRLIDGDNVVTVNLASAFNINSEVSRFAAHILQGLADSWQHLYPLLGLQTCIDFSGKSHPIREQSSGVSGVRWPTKRRRFVPAFHTAVDMMRAVHLSTLLKQKLEDLIRPFYPAPLVHNMVDAVVRAVYTQGTSVHALAGAVGLAGGIGNLYKQKRPGRDVVSFLMETFVDHTFLNCRVTSIEERESRREWQSQSGKTFRLKAPDSLCPVDARDYLKRQAYDFVVIATPLELSGLSIFSRNEVGELKKVRFPVPRKFQEVFVTFVAAEGIRRTSALNPTGGPTFTTSRESHHELKENDLLLYASWCGRSLAEEEKVRKPPLICKLTTGRELADEDLSQLFRGLRRSVRRRWFAYPFLRPMNLSAEESREDDKAGNQRHSEVNPTTFQLVENVFYPNGFEGVFSCMEGQAMASRNVAHLLVNALAV